VVRNQWFAVQPPSAARLVGGSSECSHCSDQGPSRDDPGRRGSSSRRPSSAWRWT